MFMRLSATSGVLRSVGLDVHKETISFAHAVGGTVEPPHFVGQIGTLERDLDKLVRRLQSLSPDPAGTCFIAT